VPDGDATEAQPQRPEAIRAVAVRHPGRWVAAGIVALYSAALVKSVVTNKRFGWGTVGDYLFDHRIVSGLLVTLELTAIAMLIGVVLGALAAVMRMSPNRLVSGAASFYIWFFRGTPVLVQLLIWSYIGALYPTISLGIPWIWPDMIHGSANHIITPFRAVILGFGLNEGAYMAEIVRAGILSVDEGQSEAAHALGMSRMQTMRRIVLPQAMRVIIPPTGNETISMLKTTSIATIVAYKELTYAATLIYSVNYKIIPLLLTISIWYLGVTSILYVGQFYLERYYGRGTARELPPTALSVVRARLFSISHRDASGSGFA
jgi:polar amino acid transport system permease protein